VSQSADAHYNDRRVGVELRQGALDGVIRGQRGVTERRGLSWIQAPERDQQPGGGDEHILGHPAVETEAASKAADLGPVLAVVLHRELASMAATAPPRAVDGHSVALLETRDSFSESGHPSGILMTECEGRSEA
jgi:hypothetical protein